MDPGPDSDPGLDQDLVLDPGLDPGRDLDPDLDPGRGLDPDLDPGHDLDPDLDPGQDLNPDPDLNPNLYPMRRSRLHCPLPPLGLHPSAEPGENPALPAYVARLVRDSLPYHVRCVPQVRWPPLVWWVCATTTPPR